MSEKEIQEVIEKKVVEVRKFVRGLPKEVQYEAARRIEDEASILKLFSDWPNDKVLSEKEVRDEM